MCVPVRLCASHPTSQDMPSAQKIFTDDLVVKGEEIGLVERAPNSSDDEDEDDEDIDDIIDDNAGGDKLAPGSARVHWSTQEAPTTEYISELRLADMPAGLQPIISKLKPGKISDLLRLQDGGLVMMLCGKRNRSLGLPTRDAVRDNLLQREADILARRYMRELRQDALIQVTGDDS